MIQGIVKVEGFRVWNSVVLAEPAFCVKERPEGHQLLARRHCRNFGHAVQHGFNAKQLAEISAKCITTGGAAAQALTQMLKAPLTGGATHVTVVLALRAEKSNDSETQSTVRFQACAHGTQAMAETLFKGCYIGNTESPLCASVLTMAHIELFLSPRQRVSTVHSF